MTICIINDDKVPQYMGGIKRVISILAKEWENYCDVVILSMAPNGTKYSIFGKAVQKLFPNSSDTISEENINYLVECINKFNIDIIFQPYVLQNDNLTKLCIKAKEKTNVKLVTALHFAVTFNNDLIKSYFFNKYRLSRNPVSWIKEILLYIKYHTYTKYKIKTEDIARYKLLIKHSDRFVLLSNSFVDTLKVLLKKDHINNVIAINNPVKIDSNKSCIVKKNTILWCGRVEYSTKRIDRIIDIWREIAPKHPDWELIIMGSGDIEYFRNLTKKLQIPNISFTGSCDPTQYYEQASILCMTSSSEGWGMVLVEAMQWGCVPIAYNSYSSLNDIITNGINGFSITAFDQKEYVEKLEILITDIESRKKMALKGLETIQMYESSVIAKKWINLFNDITNNR